MINQIRLLIFILIFLPYSLFGAEVQIVNLKVEYKGTPLGIYVKHPRFSWQMQAIDNKQGYKQTAFQLLVTDEGSPPDG